MRRLNLRRRADRAAAAATYCTLTIALLTVLLLLGLFFCQRARADNLQDLRDFHQGGIAASSWHCTMPGGGFDLRWHLDRVKEGHRWLPTLSVPYYTVVQKRGENGPLFDANGRPVVGPSTDPGPTKASMYDFFRNDADWQELRAGNLPVCLRFNNFGQEFTDLLRRIPKTDPAVLTKSPLVYRMFQGAIDDVPAIDPLADDAFFSTEGQLLGAFEWYQRLQTACGAPPYVIFSENNEGFIGGFAGPENLPNAIKVGTGPGGAPSLQWAPLSQIEQNSIRLRQWVEQQGTASDPYKFAVLRAQRLADKYHLFRQAFRDQLPALTANFYTSAYSVDADTKFPPWVIDQIGYTADGIRYDGFWAAFYPGNSGYTPADFTSPKHYTSFVDLANTQFDWIRQRNPRAFREAFVTLTTGAATWGQKNGVHELIDPVRWGSGYCQWVAWTGHEPGVPLLLRYWLGSTVKPGDALAGSTQGDYVKAVAAVPDRIMSDVPLGDGLPSIREFWMGGRTLPQSYNSPVKAWCVVTQLGSRYLAFLWTPCATPIDTQINVPGFSPVPVTLDRPWRYVLLEPAGLKPRILDVP